LLRELIELGFELTRTGAVNPAGTVQTSVEWLEAVLEGNVRSVAGGLGQYVQGFEGNYGSPGYSYTNAYRDGLDYLQRLMKAAAAIDDPSLQPQMRDAKFLSHLVNLGGAYAALNPNQTEQAGFFLQSAWRSQSTQQITNEFRSFLLEPSQGGMPLVSHLELLKFEQKLLSILPKVQQLRLAARDVGFVHEIFLAGQRYLSLHSELNSDEPVIIDALSSWFFDLWNAQSISETNQVALTIQDYLFQSNTVVIASNASLNISSSHDSYLTAHQIKQTRAMWESWKTTSPNNGDYSRDIPEFVDIYNKKLRRGLEINGIQLMKPLLVPINWVMIKAMIEGAETTIPSSEARKYDPMQVANVGDSLPVLQNWGEGTRYYLAPAVRERLREVIPTPFNQADEPDYSNYPQLRPEQRMDYRLSISAGIAWLIQKASLSNVSDRVVEMSLTDNRFDPTGRFIYDWTPNPRNGWEKAITDYNGGGVTDYWSKVSKKYKELMD
jgi:hypothetical protein